MIRLPDTIKMVITDFDGIMTDNFVYISDSCSSTRRINYKDVTGCFMLKNAGIDISVISGEKNPAIEWLNDIFNFAEVHQRIREKLPIMKSIIKKYKLSQEEYLYIGDDINDLECLKYAKYKITVPNATKKVKALESIQITSENGGEGAFREVADCLTKM